jgi:3-isopropylmalate/(R)-2-methylmalate dehydratase small subunit
MQALTILRGKAASLREADIDTDIIFPARFLLITSKDDLARYAFYERRYDADGAERADFPLSTAPLAGAQILIAGPNFGSGSSREHAVWALAGLGLRCIIAPSFGEIFYSNCFKSGVLPIVFDSAIVDDLHGRAERGERFVVDLEALHVTLQSGAQIAFRVEEWRRQALLNGWDEVSTILRTKAPAIAAFESRQRQEKPWLYAGE